MDHNSFYAELMEKMGRPALHRRFKNDQVTSDRLRINLSIFKVGKEAPTVVFIPGTAVYAMCYAELMVALGDQGYNVIGFDPRGHGFSDGPRGSYTIPELVRDTRAVVTYAISRFNHSVSLMGSSQGGIVAFYTAAADGRVLSAICHNLADLADSDTYILCRNPALIKVLKPFVPAMARIAPRAPIPISLYLDLSKEKVDRVGNAKEFIDQDPLALKTIGLRSLSSLAASPLPAPVEQISTSIMVLHGEDDNIFPLPYIEKLYRKLTCKKRMEVFPGLPHLITINNVEEILPPVLSWLSEIHDGKVQPSGS